MHRFFSPLYTLLFGILTLPLVLTSCATMHQGLQQPAISITDLRVQEVKPLEAVFLLELRVINPNDIELDIRGINCDLKLDGNHFATGVSDVQQKIPAFGTATLPVTIYASTFDMIGSIIQMLQRVDQRNGTGKPLHYELAGTVSLAEGTVRSLPFQAKGELNLNNQGFK